MVCSFLTNDKIYKYISNMGYILVPYSIVIGEENIYFLTPHFKFNRREIITNIELMETNKNFFDLFDYNVSNCGK